ncbi:MAG: ABC transporter permease [Oscillospiraceae bacterium]|nr:ABC transporter permease [Oscillospiraceae bacterium]
MLKYVIKRVLMGVVALFLVATITFFLMNLVPGGPFEFEKAVNPAARAALEAKYGLDKPLLEQFKNYLSHALSGDFGPSIKQRGREVNDIILTKFAVSARLCGITVIVALVIGIPLGCIAAVRRGKWLDNLIRVFATLGIAIPGFVLCTVCLYFFCISLNLTWLLPLGLATPASYILPVFSLAFYPTSYIARMMRSTMLDTLGQDYVRTAKSKGVANSSVLFKHALRNAILPIVTYLGPMMAFMMTGNFVVEQVYVIPGLGKEFISSIMNRDYTMIMGTTIFLAAILITLNVLVDIAYKIIDPRITLN